MNRPRRRRRLDGGLLWTLLVSAAAHAALLGVFLMAPNRYLAAISAPMDSYTVDLIAPGAIGGDSGPRGQGSEPDLPVAPPVPVADVAPEPEPPPPDPPPADEPPVAEEPPAPDVAVEPEAPPEPVPEKVEVAAVKPDLIEAPAATAPPSPKPTAVPPRQAATKKPAPTAVRKAAAPTAVAPPKPTQVPATATPDAAAARDRQIAEAIKKRAGAVEKPAVEDQIAAAVRRRAEQLSGGGEGVSGPLSSGPGNVAGGGTIIGAEYILFKRRMEARIRDAWVWAGPEEQLESVVRFSISPDGEIGEVRTTRSSGDPAYDASAERAVRAANPLGMVPPAYHQEFADVELTFRARDLQR